MIRKFLRNLLNHHLPHGNLVHIFTAVLVGAGTGLAAVFFIRLIVFIQLVAFTKAEFFSSFLGYGTFIFVPVLGGLVVGPIVAFWASEAKGHGVPEVMQAIVLRGGRIRPRVVLAKIMASAICIGTGGSAGREGPIIQVGSALGSIAGQWLHLSNEQIKNLVACGAAAGIAATFNAPIAGVAFASEVLMTEMQVSMFGNVAIASVAASIVSRVYLGARPAFDLPSYVLNSPWEILLYVVLGLLAALVGIMFTRMLNFSETLFDNWKVPLALKPASGALLLGLLGFAYLRLGGSIYNNTKDFRLGMPLIENIPHFFGTGFTFIEKVLQGKESFLLLFILIFLKPLATSFTLGSGNSGGVFAPSLFTGAMLGGAFGYIVKAIFPEIAGGVGAYALVGMAAVFAAAAHAPFTSMLIVFEMSNDYHMILPLMATAMVASTFSQWLHPESIYTLKLSKRGVRLETGRDLDVMQGVNVEEVMANCPVTVHKDQSVADLYAAFQETNLRGFPVMSGDEDLYGVVTLQDMERTLSEHDNIRELKTGDIATTNPITVFPDEPVWTAIRKMAPRDLARLPVVSRHAPTKLVGLISRSEILRAYEVGLMRRQHSQLVHDRMALRKMVDIKFIEIRILKDNPLVGKSVADLQLPHGMNMVSIERKDGTVYIPHGGTKIEVDDRITLLVRLTRMNEVKKIFEEPNEQ